MIWIARNFVNQEEWRKLYNATGLKLIKGSWSSDKILWRKENKNKNTFVFKRSIKLLNPKEVVLDAVHIIVNCIFMEFTLLLFHSVVICVDKVKTCCSDLVVINAAVLYSFQQMRCRQAVFYHYCINPSHTFLYFYVLEILWSLYYHNNNNSTTMFKPREKIQSAS